MLKRLGAFLGIGVQGVILADDVAEDQTQRAGLSEGRASKILGDKRRFCFFFFFSFSYSCFFLHTSVHEAFNDSFECCFLFFGRDGGFEMKRGFEDCETGVVLRTERWRGMHLIVELKLDLGRVGWRGGGGLADEIQLYSTLGPRRLT